MLNHDFVTCLMKIIVDLPLLVSVKMYPIHMASIALARVVVLAAAINIAAM